MKTVIYITCLLTVRSATDKMTDPMSLVPSSSSVQDYHADPILIADKQRLLQESDPNNPAQPGGIRARVYGQAALLNDLIYSVESLARGTSNVAQAQEDISPIFNGISDQYSKIKEGLTSLDSKLKSVKRSTDSAIESFVKENSDRVIRQISDNPTSIGSVFDAYNALVGSEFSQISGSLNDASTTLTKLGKGYTSSNRNTMSTQARTIGKLQRILKVFEANFDGLLNRKALPLLASTKYQTNANIAKVSSAANEYIQDYGNTIVQDVVKEGKSYQKNADDAVQVQGQKMIEDGAKSIQRQLGIVRSDLDRMAMKTSTSMNKNLTTIDRTISYSQRTVADSRRQTIANLQIQLANVLKMVQDFQTETGQTSNDLGTMLNDADTEITAIGQAANLGAQDIDSQYGPKIQSLMSRAKNIGSNSNQINRLQSGLSDAYNSGMQGLDNPEIKERIAGALERASGNQADVANRFDAVSEMAKTDLSTPVSVANGNLDSQQKLIYGKVTGMSSDVMAQIDESTAEREDEEASTIGKFEKGMDTKDQVMSILGGLVDKMNQKKSAVSDSVLKTGADISEELETGSGELSDQRSDAGKSQDRLNEIMQSVLPQMDRDTEDRIRSALSQLGSVHRMGTNSGDGLSSSLQAAIASLVSVKNSGNVTLPKTDDLQSSESVLKDAASKYKSQLSDFEASMNAEMNEINSKYKSVNGGDDRQIGQIVAHSQSVLTQAGRGLIQGIYNQSTMTSSVNDLIKTNPRFDVPRYLNYLLNQTNFQNRKSLLDSTLVDLDSRRTNTREGINQLIKYMESLTGKITRKLFKDVVEEKKYTETRNLRDSVLAELQSMKSRLNETIQSNFKRANETVENSTLNFYKQYQTASIISDSLVQSFSDYFAKMISVENATEYQRNAQQETVLRTIRDSLAEPPIVVGNSSEIERVNELVRIAMDTSDNSTEAIKKRKEASDALLTQFGSATAEKLKDRYSRLAANANALSTAIEAASQETTENQLGGLEGSKMGLEGVNADAEIFSDRASNLLEAQKRNAAEISDRIDQLLSGNSFLTNITDRQLTAILQSVGSSDSVYRNTIKSYKAESNDQIATIGDVVKTFANLASLAINETTDYLNQLSSNYTALIVQTDKVVNDPVESVKSDLASIRERTENVNATLFQHRLSVEPLEEGLNERIDALRGRQDEFASDIQNQLNSIISNIHKMDGDIAVSRDGGMRKLRQAFAKLNDGFKESALQYQSERVDRVPSALIETKSDHEIEQDMQSRIKLVKELLRR